MEVLDEVRINIPGKGEYENCIEDGKETMSPNNFPYPLNEDMIAVYNAKASFENDPANILKHYELKKAIHNVSLTLKSLCAAGELRDDVCCDVEDYFWGLLS